MPEGKHCVIADYLEYAVIELPTGKKFDKTTRECVVGRWYEFPEGTIDWEGGPIESGPWLFYMHGSCGDVLFEQAEGRKTRYIPKDTPCREVPAPTVYDTKVEDVPKGAVVEFAEGQKDDAGDIIIGAVKCGHTNSHNKWNSTRDHIWFNGKGREYWCKPHTRCRIISLPTRFTTRVDKVEVDDVVEFPEGTKSCCRTGNKPLVGRWTMDFKSGLSGEIVFHSYGSTPGFRRHVLNTTLCDIVGKMQDQPKVFVAKEDTK